MVFIKPGRFRLVAGMSCVAARAEIVPANGLSSVTDKTDAWFLFATPTQCAKGASTFLESQLAGKNRNDYESEYGKNPSKPHTVGGACHTQGILTMKLSSIFADTSKAKHFPAGTTFFEKGDKGEEMYVVKEGEVDIFINDFHLETVIPDGIFGELSLIDRETRIASAIARTDCTLQVIDKRRFLFLVQESPVFAIQVMKVMADRLRRVDLFIAKSDFGRTNRGPQN